MNVLIIAPHPDDETLGCGGTILKHIANGDRVAWLIVTDIKQEYGFSQEQVTSRTNEILNVANHYQFSVVYNLGMKPAGLNSENFPDLINAVGKIFNEFKPEAVYVVNRSDVHSDHRYVFQAAFSCTKPFRYPFVKKILMYECLSETEFAPTTIENAFQPNYFVDITGFLEKKLDIMSIYKSEIMPPPFPRSLENITALATLRGSTAGTRYAEAFVLLRHVDK